MGRVPGCVGSSLWGVCGLGAGLREERVRGSVRSVCAASCGAAPAPPRSPGACGGQPPVGRKQQCPAVGGKGGRERDRTDAREEAGGRGRGPRERGGGGCGVCPERGQCMAGDEPPAQGHSVAAGYK